MNRNLVLQVSFIVLSLFMSVMCSERKAVETVDDLYPEFQDFVTKASDMTDCCVRLESSEERFSIRTKSGGVFNLKAFCPVFRMDAKGELYHEGTSAGVVLDVENTWYRSPSVRFHEGGVMEIEGKEMAVRSDGLCALDCGKYIYFHLGTKVLKLPSELHERFNPPLPHKKGLLKVLFVGNSFNVDATAHLPGILAANGTTKVLMGRCYHGGCTLPQYNENYDAASHCSYRVCRPGESVWDGDEEYDTNLKHAVEAEDWDIVTFMEYTGNQCCWTWNEIEKKHINDLIDKVFAAHPQKRPAIVFMLTQTFASSSDLVAKYFDGDQMKMYDTITDFAKNVIDDTCIDKVIATGTAVQNLRTSRLNADRKQDLSRDGFHLDYGVSRYSAACTVFYNIFEPCLNLTLDGNEYRWNESIEHPTMHSIPVTDYNVGLCRHAARMATDDPLNVNDMSIL